MSKRLALLPAVVVALAAPAAALSSDWWSAYLTADGGDVVAGAAQYVSPSGVQESAQVGAHSGPLGEDPRGQVTLNAVNPVTQERMIFHGAVKDGCVRVVGKLGIAIGRLPQEQQFNVPPPSPQPFLITHVGVIVQDNGEPAGGESVDLSEPLFLQTRSAANICAGRATPGFAVTTEHGNFVVRDDLS